MQGLVYIFVALSALAIGVAGRFGLNMSIVESVLVTLVAGCIAIIVIERMLRHRAEARLERGIEDLARLLSTDAQAGGVLSQRINALVDENAGTRLDGLEADISVLGTVVRQVAEAVADLEERQHKAAAPAIYREESRAEDVEEEPLVLEHVEPTVSIEELQRAISEKRLVFHVEPIVTLPQRRTQSYDLVPRLMVEDGEFLDAPAFMPRTGHDAIVRHIEGLALQEAVSIVRRAKSGGQQITLHTPISHATLSDPLSVEQLLVTLEANRALLTSIVARIETNVWYQQTPSEKLAIGMMVKKGVTVSLTGATSLRIDFGDLSVQGVRTIRIDATQFIDQPQTFTEIHTADIASYVRRSSIELIATGLKSERQILNLLDDDIGLVQGPYIAGPSALRADLLVAPASEGARRA